MKKPAIAGFFVGLGRMPTRFLLLSQKKSGKEKAAPAMAFGYHALLDNPSGCATQPGSSHKS